MQSNFKIAQVTLLLLLSACTANWDQVVQYSPEPSRHPVIVEVYRTVLVSIADESGEAARPESLAVEFSSDPPRLEPLMSCGGVDVPNHWVDTLKQEVR